jgi:diadenosine tetraphosphate (Ap4A) HIT family hydrolase
MVMAIANQDNGSCALCPNDWRFSYSNLTAQEYGRYNENVLQKVYDAKQESDIPSVILKKFKGRDYGFVYKDEYLAIFHDVYQDMATHLLILPVDHIERFDILKYPDILMRMYCAANRIVELADFEECYIAVSNKKTDYIPHFHMHVQSRSYAESEKLNSLLYPKFYEDSEFFVV